MKRNVFLMFAMAAVLLATSCKKEELVNSKGNEATITFNLQTEDAPRTKGISDGSTVDKLYYAVYNNNGENPVLLSDLVDTVLVSEKKAEVNIPLAKGQNYKVAFWAENDDNTAYTFNYDSGSVSINYEGFNNDETRDAFFGNIDVNADDVIDGAEFEVKLLRPFAQINVGVTNEDWTAAVASGIKILKSSVTINNVANSINLFDGTVSGTEAIEYSLNVIPQETLNVDANGDDTLEAYKYLSMSYILVTEPTTSTTISLDFTFNPEIGNPIEFNQGLSTVPVQRNHRTNIVGQILTGDITFDIVIDERYDAEDYNGLPFEGEEVIYEVYNIEDWNGINAFIAENPNGTIKLMNDINFYGEGITRIGIFNGTFDGNGKTISNGYINHHGEQPALIRKLEENGIVKNVHCNDIRAVGINMGASVLVRENAGIIMGCNVNNCYVKDAYSYAAGVVSLNYKTGTIIACCANTVVLGSNGAGVAKYSCGKIIACYAKNCSYNDDTALEELKNIVDFNDDGTLTVSYFVPWTEDNTGILTSDQLQTSETWSQAAGNMNNAISIYNANVSDEQKCQFVWDTTNDGMIVSQ